MKRVVRESGAFWERGRLLYNGVQLLLTAILFIVRWPESRFLYTINLGAFFRYALLANVLYTMAYIAEALLQIPFLRPYSRAIRLTSLVGGTAFACVLASTALTAELFRDTSID